MMNDEYDSSVRDGGTKSTVLILNKNAFECSAKTVAGFCYELVKLSASSIVTVFLDKNVF